MKNYELLCIFPGTLGEEEIAPLVLEVNTVLSDCGATNISSEDRGKSRLAYPIKHIRYGYFTVFAYQGEPQVTPLVQAKLRLVTNLLRAMINEFNPEVRKEKDLVLAKLARERAEYEKPRAASQAPAEEMVALAPTKAMRTPVAPVAPAVEVVAPVVEVKEEKSLPTVEAEKPAKKTKKSSTDKPTDEDMSAIESKLDKVLDSTLEV